MITLQYKTMKNENIRLEPADNGGFILHHTEVRHVEGSEFPDRLDKHQIYKDEEGLSAIKAMQKLHRINKAFPDKMVEKSEK